MLKSFKTVLALVVMLQKQTHNRCVFYGGIRSINQSINQSSDRSNNKSINQSINQSSDRSNNKSINQSIDQSNDRSNNKSINQSISRMIGQTTNQSINQSIEWTAYVTYMDEAQILWCTPVRASTTRLKRHNTNAGWFMRDSQNVTCCVKGSKSQRTVDITVNIAIMARTTDGKKPRLLLTSLTTGA